MFGTALLLTALLAQALGDAPAGRQGIFTFRLPTTRPEIVDTRPELIGRSFFLPSYSLEARQRGIEGSVRLEVTVAADGTVSDVKIVRSLHPDLDRSSADWAKQLRFRPARFQGRAVAAPVPVRVTFSLEEPHGEPTTGDDRATIVAAQVGTEE
jgi:TonB family protein